MMDTPDGDMDMDDFLAELERMDRAPWPRRLWYYRRSYLHWPWYTLKDCYYRLIAFWQRGRHGWAKVDTDYLDIYLAEILAEMLAYLADHHYCVPYPFYEQEDGEQAWDSYLHDLAQVFKDYTSFMESDERFEDTGNRQHDQLILRMRTLFNHYSKLGD